MKTLVFLVHGFRSDSAAVNDISKYLAKEYVVIPLDLPITFDKLESAVEILKKNVLSYLSYYPDAKCHFIGHSTGGIVIRMLMNFEKISKRTISAIFIAVPNNGTVLANIYQLLPPLFREIYKPINYLTELEISSQRLVKPANVFYAGIAGFQPMKYTNMFFNSRNDGVISVESVFMKEMNDFIVLPYNHIEITHYFITSFLIMNYFKNLKFPLEFKENTDMDIGEKFEIIVRNNYINDLISQLTGNIETITLGGIFMWDIHGDFNGWRLQQHKISGFFRILNPQNFRKAWGAKKSITEAIDLVYSRMQIENSLANSREFSQSGLYQKIRELGKLKEEGFLEQDEFLNKKAELLKNIC